MVPTKHKTQSLSIRATEWRWRMDAICRCTMKELDQVILDPRTDAADRMICEIVKHAIEKGDQKRLEFILERTIGKVQENIKVTTPTPVVIKRRNGESLELSTAMNDEDEENESEPT